MDRKAISWDFLFKILKLILESNLRNTRWIVDPLMQLEWLEPAEHMDKYSAQNAFQIGVNAVIFLKHLFQKKKKNANVFFEK